MFLSNQFLYKAGECFPAWNCSPPWKFDTESVGSICVSCYPKFFSTRHIATECEWKPMWQTNWYHFLEEQGAKFPPEGGRVGCIVALKIELIYLENCSLDLDPTTKCHLMRARRGRGALCMAQSWFWWWWWVLMAVTRLWWCLRSMPDSRLLIELIDTCDKECARNPVGNFRCGEKCVGQVQAVLEPSVMRYVNSVGRLCQI